MSLRIEYLDAPPRSRLSAGTDLPDIVLRRLNDLVIEAQPEALVVDRTWELDWPAFLSFVPDLANLRSEHSFQIEYNAEARNQLNRFRREYMAIRAATLTQPEVQAENIQDHLEPFGFIRQLTPAQARDVSVMARLRNAANFSVPGAGKTTVAFAVHLLVRDENTRLLVVAPKNAFGAWDEVIQECLDPLDARSDTTTFVRLEGGADTIRRILAQRPSRAIISYDQLIRVPELVNEYLSTTSVHVVLDESHRMKAGDRSLRGSVLLNAAHLPSRRDILTGTPIPKSLDDLAAQLDFLWPGQGLGNRVCQSPDPNTLLRNLYVRTTKHELNLPPIQRHFISVGMDDGQLALYSMLREQVLSRLAGVSISANVDLVTARRSVIRLLQVASNPVLTVRRLTGEAGEDFPHNDAVVRGIFDSILAAGDAPKLRRAAEIAREILSRDAEQRVVIWTSFTENVERLAEMLADAGAMFIHGGVPVGATNDLGTREGRLSAFHNPDGRCRVLVANPAACSEGISLHRVCHHAIYVDRTYNAAHYLQSVDRIHRLGLPEGIETHVYVLESVAPGVTGSIDLSVRRRLIVKLQTMAQALEDPDLQRLALDEQEADEPLDYDITLQDVVDLIDELTGAAAAPNEEEF